MKFLKKIIGHCNLLQNFIHNSIYKRIERLYRSRYTGCVEICNTTKKEVILWF